MRKKEDGVGLATGWHWGRWSPERRIRRFRRGFGENPTCQNFKHAGTCLRQGAADLKAQAPLPPAPKKKHGDRICGAKRCPNSTLRAPFLVSWRVCGPLERHLGGIGDSRVILGGPWLNFGSPLGPLGLHLVTLGCHFGGLGAVVGHIYCIFWKTRECMKNIRKT